MVPIDSPWVISYLTSIDSVIVSVTSFEIFDVTLVHPTEGVGAFGNISSPRPTLAVLWPPYKILRRSSQGNPYIGGVKRKRGSKNDIEFDSVSHIAHERDWGISPTWCFIIRMYISDAPISFFRLRYDFDTIFSKQVSKLVKYILLAKLAEFSTFYISWTNAVCAVWCYLLLWPWPSADKLNVRKWRRYSDDVAAYQKWSF